MHNPDAITTLGIEVDLPGLSHVLGNIQRLIASSEPRLQSHMRVLVYSAELRAEMVAPDGRELLLRPLRGGSRVGRRPEDVGYDETASGIEQRKGRVEEELPGMQMEDHLGDPDAVECLATQLLAHLLYIKIENPHSAGRGVRRGVLYEAVCAIRRRWW